MATPFHRGGSIDVKATAETSVVSSVDTAARSALLRPIKLSIMMSVTGEFIIFVVWGLFLFPEGNWLDKLLWTLLFCGVGMGAAVGAAVALFIVGRLRGVAAIVATMALSIGLLGVTCNLLCLALDEHFHYFGGDRDGPLFVWNGIAMAAFGGLAVGWLCFTERGSKIGRKWL